MPRVDRRMMVYESIREGVDDAAIMRGESFSYDNLAAVLKQRNNVNSAYFMSSGTSTGGGALPLNACERDVENENIFSNGNKVSKTARWNIAGSPHYEHFEIHGLADPKGAGFFFFQGNLYLKLPRINSGRILKLRNSDLPKLLEQAREENASSADGITSKGSVKVKVWHSSGLLPFNKFTLSKKQSKFPKQVSLLSHDVSRFWRQIGATSGLAETDEHSDFDVDKFLKNDDNNASYFRLGGGILVNVVDENESFDYVDDESAKKSNIDNSNNSTSWMSMKKDNVKNRYAIHEDSEEHENFALRILKRMKSEYPPEFLTLEANSLVSHGRPFCRENFIEHMVALRTGDYVSLEEYFSDRKNFYDGVYVKGNVDEYKHHSDDLLPEFPREEESFAKMENVCVDSDEAFSEDFVPRPIKDMEDRLKNIFIKDSRFASKISKLPGGRKYFRGTGTAIFNSVLEEAYAEEYIKKREKVIQVDSHSNSMNSNASEKNPTISNSEAARMIDADWNYFTSMPTLTVIDDTNSDFYGCVCRDDNPNCNGRFYKICVFPPDELWLPDITSRQINRG